MAGSTQVQIPVVIPRGQDYSILVVNGNLSSYLSLFTINSTLPSSSTRAAAGDTKGSSVGAIAGAVAGAVVIIATISGFLCMRHKKAITAQTKIDAKEADAEDFSQLPQEQNIDQVTQFSNYNTPVTTLAHACNPQEAISSPYPRNPQLPHPESSAQGTKIRSFGNQNEAEPPVYSSPQWRHEDQETVTSTMIVSLPSPSTLAPHAIPTLQDSSYLFTGEGISDDSRRNLAQKELALLQAQYDLQIERLRAEQDIKVRNIQNRLG
ncbi:hypothetical protein BGZ83_011735 [Gryganskiella cystojenkinii]|nr:hypothetical protein BGZ83_011735 [Gryganskiella cystojenkinii]